MAPHNPAPSCSPAFAGELFGPGQLLDASKYFIILPDAIGHGKSSKPSEGMRAKFPRYNYDDMVAAQYKRGFGSGPRPMISVRNRTFLITAAG